MDLVSNHPDARWAKPRSAYIHIPFCRHRCGYCNFSVVADRDDLIDRYVKAITEELDSLKRPLLDTLFLGGGTPTHLSNSQLNKLLESLNQLFDLNELTEFSVEANPEDIDQEKLDCLQSWGVNRISFGIQSFRAEKLNALQRNHTGKEAVAAIELAANMFNNLSIDLIFGAPGETTSQWEADLETALALPVQHLSTYALTYEKGTQFWNRRRQGAIEPVDEQTEVEMYQAALHQCGEKGFRHYEISSFERDNHRCLHNMAYWKGEGWYAAGPGAARFVDGFREVNHRSTFTYLRRMEKGISPTEESESIDPIQYASERIAFGIRLIEGICLPSLDRQLGMETYHLFSKAILRSIEDALIEDSAGHLKLTRKGILFADTVAQRFLDCSAVI